MSVSLTTHLPPTRSGRTLFISSYVLGAFALAQMAMLGWHLFRSNAARPAEAPTIRFAETTEVSTSSMDVPYRRNPQTADPFASAAVTSPGPGGATAAPVPNTPTIALPTPAPPERFSAADLIEQAKLLRQNGDATTALAKLRQAEQAEPANPQVLAELGITYETMQLTDRAFEEWRRLFAMGDAIGAPYYLADARLHSAPAAPPAPGTAFPGVQEPTEAAAPGRDAAGFQDSAMLKITDIRAEELEDPTADKKVSLKIVVKNRPGSAIDPKKVKIETYFYDLLDGKDVVQTDAQTGYNWLTAPVNWANDESEVLETIYYRPKAGPTPAPAPTPDDTARAARRTRRGKGHGADSGADAADAPPAAPAAPVVRTYLGYTVRLYYDRQLQDVKADPLRLLQQFPPPLTLPED